MTFKIEAGKRYVAINGVVTGPLIPGYIAGKFKCPDRSIRQLHGPENSQVWNSDGTVYHMNKGESEHGLIAEYVEDKGVKELESALNRISELEGINSALEHQLTQERAFGADSLVRAGKAEERADHWKSEYLKVRYGHNGGVIGSAPGSHPKAFIFDNGVMNASSAKRSGGISNFLRRDAERTLDKRIDNAFTAINRLQRELDDERSSTNARALFFGALAGVVVVAVAFGAHFVL